MNRFNSKVVIVTGAGSGIGAATVQRFYEEGAMIVLSGRNKEKLEHSAQKLDPQRILIVPTDVSQWADVEKLISITIVHFGRLDVLVNNAGVGWEGQITDESALSDWQNVFATNANGVFYACRAAIPHLSKTRGAIVNVSSVTGLGGDWGMSIYNASKGAVSNLTRALALDYGSQGIRVNAVCPTYIVSDMSQFVTANPDLVAKFAERIPLKRGGTPQEVADVIIFLASQDARFITGVNLPVDGGVTASSGQPNLLGV
ncbi:2-(R)-hydroxypropyl-CoM dehydrogenase [Xenorhabdus poinarii G6]|uniref:2-(R)-hydroxypropyl-CoM dehydrogenase n=1 Tax=Xenorhabdus poinarii G6 TaxID=1354304 RepID=A0A068R3I1_9GAMM|nr:SDR family oxidoreductase [Xenorhabdus poinarii]CDG21599.1 2-(R)-hydroxypropyl-CoM dehydrogenase [Xenorhabdus poinarii G6]